MGIDYDLAAERESDAGAFADGLGGEPGTKDLAAILRPYALSGVRDRNVDPRPFDASENGDRPLALDRLGSVDHQIQQHLVQEGGEAFYVREILVEVRHKSDSPAEDSAA